METGDHMIELSTVQKQCGGSGWGAVVDKTWF